MFVLQLKKSNLTCSMMARLNVFQVYFLLQADLSFSVYHEIVYDFGGAYLHTCLYGTRWKAGQFAKGTIRVDPFYNQIFNGNKA